jgi:glycosyltransferase involved in cell wall biosynthesis
VIHAHTFSCGLLAVLVGRPRRVPVVVTENYGDLLGDELSAYEKHIARFTYRHAHLVCPVSRLLERRLVQLEPRGRYRVVPDVVDIDGFAGAPRARRDGAGAHVVAVSMLVHGKGLHDLLDAMRLIASSGREISLTIIGDGPERSALETRAAGLHVEFLGALTRAEVATQVRAADVFAMPTLGDSFGISAVEALAAGIPVVVTSASGTADFIGAHGGLVVPPADSRTLAHALVELLDRAAGVPPSTTDELRRWCSPDAVADQLNDIYRAVCTGRPQRRPRRA